MKSIGDQVKDFMTVRALNSTAMAELVTRTGLAKRKVNRQDIDNLTRGDVELPKYINALAKAMGVAVGCLTGAESADSADHWPFPDIDRSRFSALSLRQQIEIQGVVRERIEKFESPPSQAAHGQERAPSAEGRAAANGHNPSKKRSNGQ